jgi:hypothetical protein
VLSEEPVVIHNEQILEPPEVDQLTRLWHEHARYDAVAPGRLPKRLRRHTSELVKAVPRLPRDPAYQPTLVGRIDTAAHERLVNRPSRQKAPGRGNYFRANYAYPGKDPAPLVAPFLDHEGLVEAARSLFDCRRVQPAIAYANVLLPGQELGVHTDVPEFVGADRRRYPLWLLVVMHHSGLFADERVPIATAVVYAGECRGGDFVYFEPGHPDQPIAIPPAPGAAVVMDGDTLFHAIDPVGRPGAEPPEQGLGMHIVSVDDRRWELRHLVDSGPTAIRRYRSDRMRYSLSWKAYCFRSEKQHRDWKRGLDEPMPVTAVLDRLCAELARRDRLPVGREALSDDDLGRLLVEEFIRFPTEASV